MASSPVNVAQDLNNAIYSLASLNPSNPIAGGLNNSWQIWFATAPRSIVPQPAWWATFKGFWAGYAAARLSAQNLSERTPAAADIDPTLWKTLLSDVEERDALLGDVSRQARDATRAKLDEAAARARAELAAAGDAIKDTIFDASKPAIFVSVVIGIALIATSMRGGRR